MVGVESRTSGGRLCPAKPWRSREGRRTEDGQPEVGRSEAGVAKRLGARRIGRKKAQNAQNGKCRSDRWSGGGNGAGLVGTQGSGLDDSPSHDRVGAMNQEVHQLARAAGQAAQAERVYVFGSQARGEARADSDVDIALVIADGASPRKALRAAIAATAQRKQALDLVVIAHSTWARGSSLLAREVKQEGVLVYGN